MIFDYETINDALHAHHPELSGYWTSLGWDDQKATVAYDLEDGTEHEVFVHKDGTVEAPDVVIQEMNEIASL